jgi:DNA-binding transcriptional ArsR family regulator
MSPIRSEVAEALRLAGPCSVAEIALIIDRPADTLYRHIDALRKAGFVAEAGLRKKGRTAEQLFDMVAADFVPDFSHSSVLLENRITHSTAATLLKAMERTVRDAAAARAIVARQPGRNTSMSYELGWLTPAMYQEVRALIGRLKVLMDESKKTRTGRLYMTLAIACPVVRKRGARNPAPPTKARAPRAAQPSKPVAKPKGPAP